MITLLFLLLPYWYAALLLHSPMLQQMCRSDFILVAGPKLHKSNEIVDIPTHK